jgi:hypothetical protein
MNVSQDLISHQKGGSAFFEAVKNDWMESFVIG